MNFSIARLLLHSSSVPEEAREALKSALGSQPERRGEELEQAARLLHAATGLDCGDARELVGLDPVGSC